MRTWYVHYVPWQRIRDFELCGWMVAERIANPYSIIMSWPCSCKMVRPLDPATKGAMQPAYTAPSQETSNDTSPL